MAGIISFSRKQYEHAVRCHGRPGYGIGWTAHGMGWVEQREVAVPLVAYLTPDGSEILVGSEVRRAPSRPSAWDDLVDLGAVGEHLHSFRVGGPVPVPGGPMRLPAERGSALVSGTLSAVEMLAAQEAAHAAAVSPRYEAAR